MRSLTLKYGTLAQFDRIRPQHFPRLDKTKSFDNLFEVILSNRFKKFVLESWLTLDMTADRQSDDKTIHCIRGRVFPERDPYCFASFLVEIKLPPEYPFKKPQATILDPIYNPNFMKTASSSYRYCWISD